MATLTTFRLTHEVPLISPTGGPDLILPIGTTLHAKFYDLHNGEWYIEAEDYVPMQIPYEYAEKVYPDPDYFGKDVGEALHLAAQRMKVVYEVVGDREGHNPQVLQDQVVEMAHVIAFLGALVAKQEQEIEALKRQR